MKSESAKPTVRYPKIAIDMTFKGNNGVFSVYNRETKEKKDIKSVDVIFINDQLSKIIPADPGSDTKYMSDYYMNKHDKITVFKVKDGKASVFVSGKKWKGDISNNEDSDKMKYSKRVFCLSNIDGKWMNTELSLTGIAVGMFIDLKSKNDVAVHTLEASDKKNLQVSGKMFYSFGISKSRDLKKEEGKSATVFANDIQNFIDDLDAKFSFYNKDEEAAPQQSLQDEIPVVTDRDDTTDYEEKEEFDELDINDVPF